MIKLDTQLNITYHPHWDPEMLASSGGESIVFSRNVKVQYTEHSIVITGLGVRVIYPREAIKRLEIGPTT